jgi:hypothetical protein
MTNPTADAEATRTVQEPLGTMLVRRGLLTAEQLEAALDAQKTSGDPLGKIVVALGYATPSIIAQALATQHGGLLKTEYGFATGFGATLGTLGTPMLVSEPPVSVEKVSPLKIDNRPAFGAPDPPRPDDLRSELAHASAETERLQDDNDRLVKLRAELEQRLAGESQRAAALERELEAAKATGSGTAELDARIAALEAEVAARDSAIEEFKQTGEGWKAALAERDAAITELVAARDAALVEAGDGRAAESVAAPAGLEALQAEIADLRTAHDDTLALLRTAKAELAERDAQIPELTAERDAALEKLATSAQELPAPAPERWESVERHLLFFQGNEGYELVERQGPPPAPGDRVEVPGGPQLVGRIGPSPAPGPRLACAYLIAV